MEVLGGRVAFAATALLLTSFLPVLPPAASSRHRRSSPPPTSSSPSPTGDDSGAKLDQAIAFGLMVLALAVTYIVH
ncbi:unnamed protein product [Linum trigynum]|uniref:Uncharacterized protein n=1 Tax=Linum trigynum TaxID=586398 RepID=A0AAV2GJT9_9ROSI